VKSLLGVLIVSLAAGLIAAPVLRSQTNQQERLRRCSIAAEGRKLAGDAQKTFIEDCVNGKEGATALPSPQQKFRSCSLKADEQKLSGNARKDFMATCRTR
jgi:psiF repeat